MSVTKNIFWRPDMSSCNNKGNSFCHANVHLIVCYWEPSLKGLRELAEQLRETFPDAKDDEITFSKITESSCVKGGTIAMYNGIIQRDTRLQLYKDWRQFHPRYYLRTAHSDPALLERIRGTMESHGWVVYRDWEGTHETPKYRKHSFEFYAPYLSVEEVRAIFGEYQEVSETYAYWQGIEELKQANSGMEYFWA